MWRQPHKRKSEALEPAGRTLSLQGGRWPAGQVTAACRAGGRQSHSRRLSACISKREDLFNLPKTYNKRITCRITVTANYMIEYLLFIM